MPDSPVYEPEQREAVLYNESDIPAHSARLLAFLFDSLLLSLIADLVSIVAVVLFSVDGDLMTRLQVSAQADDPSLITLHLAEFRLFAVIMIGAYLIPAALYHVFFEGSFLAATPGKMICGLNIVDTANQPLSVDKALKRFMVKGSAFIFPAIMIPGLSVGCTGMGLVSLGLAVTAVLTVLINVTNPLFVLLQQERRGLHDMVAGSHVVTRVDVSAARYVACLIAIGLTVAARKLISGY